MFTAQPILIYILLFLLFLLLVCLAVTVFAYHNKKVHSYEGGSEEVMKAHKEAMDVLLAASKKSAQMVSEIDGVNLSAKKVIEEQMRLTLRQQSEQILRLSNELLMTYQKEFNEAKNKDINIFQNISKNIESSIEVEIKEFMNQLHLQTVGSQQAVEKKLEESYGKVQQEIELHEVAQLKKVDENIFQIIQAVSKEVLGQAIRLEQHEQLVFDSLDKAKAELARREKEY